MNPEDHIKDIKSRYLNADKEFVLSSLNRGIDRLQKAFPRYGSFMLDLSPLIPSEQSPQGWRRRNI